ncbi:MAG TPA: TonB-dependent receptor, partial [Azonexus sp.]|nr:TonB-dependent receptor [Azonexus sp.]
MLRPTLLVAALTAAYPAFANNDIDALRAELREMKATYESRIQALEARLQETEAKTADAAAKADLAPQQAAEPPPAGNHFNPETSLILQGRYARLDDIDHRHISGFLPAGHEHDAQRGFSLDHTELILSASVDPYFRGYFNIALLDEEVEIEEAWFQTTSLGNGLSLKGGRFLSGIGYQNEHHPHAWDFADNN